MLSSIPRSPNFRRQRHLVWMLPLFVFVADVSARSNETTTWTDQDFAMYPQFCRARIEREPKELVDYWTQRLGAKNYLHIHHFCFGLKALNLAYGSLKNRQRREFMANAVVGNFNYVIDNTEKTLYLRPEAFVYLGKGYFLRQEYDLAQQKYFEALKLNPKMVDAWVAISDMYYEVGKRPEALSVLEQASQICGENKKIDLRIADMRNSGIKASATEFVPIRVPTVAPSAPAAESSADTEQIPTSTPAQDPAPAE